MARRKAVTIRDVAQLAEVSVSTVSQILNGNREYVTEAKRERVLSAVQQLQYRPNALARSMAKRHTATVGVVFTSIVGELFQPIVECLQNVLHLYGYTIILASTPDVESEMEAIETLKAQQVDGFIFVSFRSEDSQCQSAHLLLLKEEGIPFVVINRPYSQEYDIHQIRFHDREAGYLATKHLIKLGHTSLGTMSGPLHHIPAWESAIERQQGWVEALKEHDLEVVPEWIYDGGYNYEGGYEAAQWFLEHWDVGGKRPTALFVANEKMTLGAMRAFYAHGVQVPHDVALVTVGDPAYAAHLFPPLTTFAHPILEAGQLATQILLDQLHATEPLPTQKILLSYQLHVRKSCGSRPEDTHIKSV